MLTEQRNGLESQSGDSPDARPPSLPPNPENGISASEPSQTEDSSTAPGGLMAASALASSAVIAELVQIAGTGVFLFWGQKLTGTSNPVEAVGAMVEYIRELGTAGYAVFATAMITLQVVPIAAAFILTVSAGAIFGTVKGTAMVSLCSTVSASISFLIARSLGRDLVLEAAQSSKQYKALDTAFGDASLDTSLTLVTLLRLSPILPFAWANYIFGLSPVPLPAFVVGTLVGSLPAVAAYVSAGQLSADIAINGGGGTPPWMLGLGLLATLGSITVAGNIANDALKEMDVDLLE